MLVVLSPFWSVKVVTFQSQSPSLQGSSQLATWNLWKNKKHVETKRIWWLVESTHYILPWFHAYIGSVFSEMAGFSIHFLGDLKPPSTSRIKLSPPPLASLPWPSRPSPYQVVNRALLWGGRWPVEDIEALLESLLWPKLKSSFIRLGTYGVSIYQTSMAVDTHISPNYWWP